MTAREDQSLASLEAGGLPLAAQERLARVATGATHSFTSDFSASEFLLAREAGFRPLTQVMGTCFYHLGWQGSPYWQTSVGSSFAFPGGQPYATQFPYATPGQTVELETTTEAWNEARRLAIGRLEQEARLAGADAVVGVRLQRGAYDWAAGLLEFVVTGTAIVSERYDLRTDDDEPPMLSNLSGQEFAALFRNGWWPAGLVAGSTVCYVMTGWAQQARLGTFFGGMQNQELSDFTRGLYDARSQAMMRATRQGHELGAHGVIGLQFQHEEHEHEQDRGGVSYKDLIVTIHVLGTAVVEVKRAEEDPPVYIALPLG